MRQTHLPRALAVWLTILAAGCGGSADNQAPVSGARAQDTEAKIRAALDRLSPEDRKVAEAQRYCAVEPEHRLGSMSTPVKVMLNGQPVFLCCKSCVKDAEEHPDQTLAKARELKAKAVAPPGS
jgi:hypothetical protein